MEHFYLDGSMGLHQQKNPFTIYHCDNDSDNGIVILDGVFTGNEIRVNDTISVNHSILEVSNAVVVEIIEQRKPKGDWKEFKSNENDYYKLKLEYRKD